jgi:hypothetical protein
MIKVCCNYTNKLELWNNKRIRFRTITSKNASYIRNIKGISKSSVILDGVYYG